MRHVFINYSYELSGRLVDVFIKRVEHCVHDKKEQVEVNQSRSRMATARLGTLGTEPGTSWAGDVQRPSHYTS